MLALCHVEYKTLFSEFLRKHSLRRCRRCADGLACDELRKKSRLRSQFLKRSLLHDSSTFHDVDPIGLLDRAEAVRHENARHLQAVQAFGNNCLRVVV